MYLLFPLSSRSVVQIDRIIYSARPPTSLQTATQRLAHTDFYCCSLCTTNNNNNNNSSSSDAFVAESTEIKNEMNDLMLSQ